MTNDAERRREEQMISACASHAWNVSDRSDFEKKGIKTEAHLKERIREVINDPRTKAFKCQPKMDPDHPRGGEQFPREVYLLREGSRTTVVVLNASRVAGSAWIGSGNQENRMLRDEMRKNNLVREPEIVVGGRPALLEREKHQQVVEYRPNPSPKFDPKFAKEELMPARAVQPEPQRQQASRPPAFDPKHAREEIAPARKVQPEPSRERQVQPPPQPERPKPAPEPQREIPSRRRDYEREL